MLVRYGKPILQLFTHKQIFFDQDEELRAKAKIIADIYKDQPVRDRCVCCEHELSGSSFTKCDVPYVICTRCGHLNGRHRDTPEFCDAVYGGDSYTDVYSGDFEKRVDDIYKPKADFLREALESDGAEASSVFDFGAGAGHFIVALESAGFDASGFEPSSALRDMGNDKLGREAIAGEPRYGSEVVSFIHVLEHIPDFRQTLKAVKARYLYIAVPLYSPAVFFECAFPEVFHRHLTNGHTHLFSKQSIDHLCDEFGMTRVAEWWFGADMMDLYRMILMSIEPNMREEWSKMALPALNDLQAALDKNKCCSEVHFLARMA